MNPFRLLPSVFIVMPMWTQAATLTSDFAAPAPLSFDESATFATLANAAEAGNAIAQYKLADAYFDDTEVEKGLPKAFFWYAKAAEQGNRDAQYQLGRMYRYGYGTIIDAARALSWYRQAADQGLPVAMNDIGVMYADGSAGAVDLVTAAHWFTLGAKAGNAMSMERLGHLYLNGYGVGRDASRAATLFQQSADLGYDPAKLQLAWCLETGTGLAPDEARALVLYQDGLARNDVFARKQLVLMLQDGRGGPSDTVKAAGLVAAMVADADTASLGDLAMLYHRRQQRDQAQSIFDAALRLEQRGIAPAKLVVLLNKYALFCIENSEFRPAQTSLIHALELAESVVGPTAPSLIETIEQLGFVYTATQRYSNATDMFERSLAIRRAHGIDITPPLTRLGIVAAEQGHYKEAEQRYREARAYLNIASPARDTAVAENDARMAALYNMQGNYAAALPLLVNAIKVQEAQLRPDNAELIEVLIDLGTTYFKLNRIDEAADTESHALAISKKLYGPSHHRVATALNDLGVMELYRNHLDSAEVNLQEALAMREKLLGPGHPDCATSLGGLAALSVEQGKYAAAERYLLRSLSINEAAMGRFHPQVGGDLRRLGSLYVDQAQYEKAEPVLARAWSILQNASVSMNEKQATSKLLAQAYRGMQREQDALAVEVSMKKKG